MPSQLPDVFEFARGQKDCRDGLPARIDESRDYQRGYGFEYEMQEIKSNTGRKQ